MSSTNRSNARDRHKADYYITPVDKVVEFLNEFNKHEDIFTVDNVRILDPCAGGDESNAMSYPEALKLIGVDEKKITTIDIREDSLAEIKDNYLETDVAEKYDVAISNPPFNLAREIIEKAMKDVKDGGFVIMLLRLNYFGSKARKDMWETQLPKYCFVHHRRMSFTDDGRTDSIEYCHMVWQKGHYPEFTKLQVI